MSAKAMPRLTRYRISIRKALPSDAARISVLNNQLGYPYAMRKVRSKLKQLLGDNDHLILVASQPDGFVCGWIHVHVYRLFYADRMAEISGLVVDENFRDLGIGNKLMKKAERWARAKRCRFVSLRSNIIRKQAHSFYAKLGYRNIKTQYTYRKQL